MESIARRRGKGKRKVCDLRKGLSETLKLDGIDDLDVKVWLLQAGIPAMVQRVYDLLNEEVERLAGAPRKHGKVNVRWGRQGGSVYLLEQKVPVVVPRVRSKQTGTEVPLESYGRLQEPRQADERAYRQLIHGMSTHRYRDAAAIMPEVYGISASSMSQRFIRQTTESLRRLQERRLDRYDFAVIFMDGKRFADDGVIIPLGITLEGEKVILGMEQMATENSIAIEQFFERLKERGLNLDSGVLFVIDGSKGIVKAIRRAFPEARLIQRCQWHKIENIVSYLPKGQQSLWRQKLRQAYAQANYTDAKRMLLKLQAELEQINPSAASSLEEGLEETLTLHRLGMYAKLGKSLSTTNCLESVMSQVEQYTSRVDCWRNGAQIQRWTAAALLEIEPRLNRIRGWRNLSLLRERMQQELWGSKENLSVKERALIEAGA